MKIHRVEELLDTACSAGGRWRLSVAAPYDSAIFSAVAQACKMGFAQAVLFGRRDLIERTAQEIGVNLDDPLYTLVETATDDATTHEAARFIHQGHADVLVKGLTPTGLLMRAVLSYESGFRSNRLLSHVGVFNEPTSGRLMLLTDAGVNIAPNVHRKVQIVRNAVIVAQALGIAHPRVAMLAATETLNYPAMPATLDAALVSRIASSGAIPHASVEGPFALDNAVSTASADKKHIKGDVAGRADILCGPEIETANVLYKALQTYCGVTFASVVVGASKPIAVPSRVDSTQSKLMSLSLACLLSGAPCTASS